METLLFVAAWLFAVTHLDTFVVLVAFCTDEEYRTIEVLVGHLAGFLIGLAVAVVAAVVATGIFHAWTFLLGFVPLSMGLWGLLRRRPDVDPDETAIVPGSGGRIGVVTATGIGLSGENIAVFVPFFVGLEPGELAFVLGTYLVGAGVVFLLALLAGRRAATVGLPEWVGRWLVPIVLVVVGAYVLLTGWIAT